MKFPNHIILDVSSKYLTSSSDYWVFKYFLFLDTSPFYKYDLSFQKKFLMIKEKPFLNKILKSQQKFTVRYNYTNESVFLSKELNEFFKNLLISRPKVKRKIFSINSDISNVRYFWYKKKQTFDERYFFKLFKNFKMKNNDISHFKNNLLWSLFDVNFFKKERIYTKLKYSRVPQYDIVSGGGAALLAGFLGFLICEKFGFELLDSNDFYILFMYSVFFCFFCRPFLKILNETSDSWNILSFKWFFTFYKFLIIFVISFFKKLFFFLL